MWKPVDENSPIFWLKGDINMYEFWIYEVWIYDGEESFPKYFLESETGIKERVEELLEGIYKGYEIKSVNRLCAEEEISNGLWKESVVSRFADKVEKILLEYRCANNFELGRDADEMKEIATYIFDEITKEWNAIDNFTYVTNEIDKMTKEELEKNK